MLRLSVLLSLASLFACATPRAKVPFAQAFAAQTPASPPAPLAVAPVPVSSQGFLEELDAFSQAERRMRALARPGVPMPQAQVDHWAGLIACVEGLLEQPLRATPSGVVAAGERVIQRELELDGRTWGDFPPPLAEAILKSQADLGVRVQALLQRAQTKQAIAKRVRLSWPIAPVTITSLFGRRMHPILRRVRRHDGVDLAAAMDQLVNAAGPGTVVRAGPDGGYGLMVEIRHARGLVTRYAHLDELLVIKGAKVQAGEAIGLAGETGLATGVHVHFEVLRHGRPVDPLSALGAPPPPRRRHRGTLLSQAPSSQPPPG